MDDIHSHATNFSVHVSTIPTVVSTSNPPNLVLPYPNRLEFSLSRTTWPSSSRQTLPYPQRTHESRELCGLWDGVGFNETRVKRTKGRGCEREREHKHEWEHKRKRERKWERVWFDFGSVDAFIAITCHIRPRPESPCRAMDVLNASSYYSCMDRKILTIICWYHVWWGRQKLQTEGPQGNLPVPFSGNSGGIYQRTLDTCGLSFPRIYWT